MLIKREIQEKIEKDLWKGKIIIVYGARQVGKTTLVNQILKKYPGKTEYYIARKAMWLKDYHLELQLL